MANAGKTAAERLKDSGNIAEYRRAARLIHALEESKASYQSLEMRVRSWTHNRILPSYVLKTGEKDPLLAKMLRGAIIGGATYAALQWCGGIDPAIATKLLGTLVPEFVMDKVPFGVLPAIGAAAAGFQGQISKLTLESVIQVPRLIDYVRFNWQMRKLKNREWYESFVSNLTDKPRPFSNFEDLHNYCKDVVKDVHPAKQTKSMEQAVENTRQLDFWAKDLAIRINQYVASEPMTLEQATSEALIDAPWATKYLHELKIVRKELDDPTAYGRVEFQRTYRQNLRFSPEVNAVDMGILSFKEDRDLDNSNIKQRISGLSARFENAMNRTEITSNLLSGSGAAAAVAVTTMGGLGLLAAGSGNVNVQAAHAFLNHYMAVAPAVMTGALTVQAPLRVMQMFDNAALLAYKVRNFFDHDLVRYKNENWNDKAAKLSLKDLRSAISESLEHWRDLRGAKEVEHTTVDTARVARELTVERLLHQALQYKLQQPRLDLDTLIKGLTHERGFQRDVKPLQSLERPQPGVMPMPKQGVTDMDAARRLKQHLERSEDAPPAPPAKHSLSL